jgi:large subunit ribosomal protein L47
MLRRMCASARLARRGLEEFQDKSADVYGRAWKASELRTKSFDDLHKLWYVLLKEKNMLMSLKHEAKRTSQEVPNFGRLKMVKVSMARLKTVVGERSRAHKQQQQTREQQQTDSPRGRGRGTSLRHSKLPANLHIVRNVSKPLTSRTRKQVNNSIKAAKIYK